MKQITNPEMEPAVVNVSELVQFADKGIVSKTVYESSCLKLVHFTFEKGQALSEHAAPFEAVIHVLEGKGTVRLGGVDHNAAPGALYVMPANLPHAVKADERFVFLLTMAKSAGIRVPETCSSLKK